MLSSIAGIVNGITTRFHNTISNLPSFIAAIISMIVAFLSPIWVPVLGVLFIILIDLHYGLKVSKKLERLKVDKCLKSKAYIESRKWWHTVDKLSEAFFLLLCGHIVDTSIVVSVNLHLVEIFAGVIAGGEIISIIESLIELHPNRRILKILKKVIKSKGEKYLEIDLNAELQDCCDECETSNKSYNSKQELEQDKKIEK